MSSMSWSAGWAVRPYMLPIERAQHRRTSSSMLVSVKGALMNSPGVYLHWGVIQISVANLAVIGLMIAVFLLALFLPFPGRRK